MSEGSATTAAASARSRTLATLGAGTVVALATAATVFTGYAALHVPAHHGGLEIVPLALESLVAPVVGLLIVRRHPRHVIGWLLVLHGLVVAPIFDGGIYAQYAFFTKHNSWPAAGWVAVLTDNTWPLLFVPLALIGYLFPDGRFLSRRWRRLAVGCLILIPGYMVAATITLTKYDDNDLKGVPIPFHAASEAPLAPFEIAGLLAIPAFLIGAVLAARRRFRHATGEERLKLLWFATAAIAIPGGLGMCLLDGAVGGDGSLTFLGVTILGTVVPLTIGVAILRHRLFDVELVLSRALTYATLTVLVVAVYAAVLAAFRAALNDTAAGLIGVGVVAVTIQPVHARLRRRIERWVYGDRSDPYAAVRRLSQRVEGLADPTEVVRAVTTSIAEALRVPAVSVELDAAASAPGLDLLGDPTPATTSGAQHRVPLVHHGRRLGDLVVAVPAGRQLSGADQEMLGELARHAAAVVNAVHLTLELQLSRSRLVSAREEERRRLRRDLHDGVGPSLAAMVLKLNAVSATVDNPVAAELLGQVRAEAKDAIAEIRRLVDDLRPPALDEVGLVAALRQKAAALSEAPLLIDVDGPERLPPLPAAAEVAAYRIALEAMTNAARHAAATRCRVTVAVNGAVEIDVADNGRGLPRELRPGVGLTSMRERAAELSGSCSVTRRGESGTLVRAIIPLPGVAVPPQVDLTQQPDAVADR